MSPAIKAQEGRWWLLALAVTVADQWSKWMVESHLPQGVAHPLVPGWFHLAHIKNSGVAFGWLGGGDRLLMTALPALALAAVFYLFCTTPRRYPAAVGWLAVLLGGAAGNLLDRVFVGAVTDWANVQFFRPTFNFADVAIGAALMGLTVTVVRAYNEAESPAPVAALPAESSQPSELSR